MNKKKKKVCCMSKRSVCQSGMFGSWFMLWCLLLVVGLQSCASASSVSGTVRTDSIFIDCPGRDSLSIHVEYPIGSSMAVLAMTERLSEALGGSYPGEYGAVRQMIRYYADSLAHAMWQDSVDLAKDGVTVAGQVRLISFRKVYETNKLVTFLMESYTYSGGAHGYGLSKGFTFRKSDGRLLDWSMIREYVDERGDAPSLRSLLAEGLKKHWGWKTDEELKEMTFIENPDYVDLPLSYPYITDKGLVFIYQSAEIASYAAGAAEVVLPLKDALPYLNITGRRMVE